MSLLWMTLCAWAGTHQPAELLLTDALLPAGAGGADFVAELDPQTSWPAAGDRTGFVGHDATWRRVTTKKGTVKLTAVPEDGVLWAALYATSDRYADWSLQLEGAGALRVWVDGAAQGSFGAPGDKKTSAEVSLTLPRGQHRVLVRLEETGGLGGKLSFTVDSEAEVGFDLDPAHPVSDYAELQQVASLSGVTLSPDGSLLTWAERKAGHTTRWVRDVVSGETRTLPGAPVQWRADSRALLVSDEGRLLVWERGDGALSEVLSDEPGLGAVSWSSDGRTLVFASTRGTDAPPSAVRRRTALREKLADWPTRPHLFQLDLQTGARRRLVAPGDFSQDRFALTPDGTHLVHLRSVPTEARPWFATEVRLLDLGTGEDRLVTTVEMGFENRPGLSGFALSPDGQRLAFVGPPSELGKGSEPNAFDPDLHVLSLSDGTVTRVSAGYDPAVASEPVWDEAGTGLWFTAHKGARDVLVHLALGASPVATEREVGAERAQSVAVSATGLLAAVVSNADSLPRLVLGEEELVTVSAPNAGLEQRWELATPVDASFTDADGVPIEGWLYLPTEPLESPIPLVAYYYGGASPTLRGFNELHQFLVGNGYAVFVCNPRGAPGYGEDFASAHVAELAERSSADVLAGIDAVLAAHPELDGEHISAYGGSYGGYLTMSLLTRTERFSAAAALYGISNLASYFGEGMWGYTYGDQAINRYPWAHPDDFVKGSPLFAADRITTPLLLMHGDVDGNVPPGESEQMFTALSLLDRPVELVRFAGEDHGLRGTWDNRIAHRTMMLEWFDRWLRDQPEAWEARWR